jgi:hypothetical protein
MDSGRHVEFAPTPWLMRPLLPRMVFGLEPVAEQRARFVGEVVLLAGPLHALIKPPARAHRSWVRRLQAPSVQARMRAS